MIELMKRLQKKRPPANVYFGATTQEEIGLRGARTSSYLVKPDIGISLEAGVAANHPGITQDEAQEVLGKGPGLFLFDASMIPSVNLTVPIRYLHTRYGVMDRGDFDALVDLLTAVVYELTPARVEEIKKF